MKNFLKIIAMFLAIVSVITIGINYMYMLMDKSDVENTYKFRTIPESIDICNFGSSHGRSAFCYDEYSELSSFNFALTSQTLSYDKRLYDTYQNNISKGAVVFIPLSYFSLFGVDETNDPQFLEKNKRYYRILPDDEIKHYDLKTDIYSSYFPSLTAGSNLIPALLGMTNDVNEEVWLRVSTDIDVERDAALACKRHLQDKYDDDGSLILNYKEYDALTELIRCCYQNDVTPILITTPFLREYNNKIVKYDPTFFDKFYEIIDHVLEETGCMYFDYSTDERFIDRKDLFMNSDHLNKEGAKLFVNIIMDEIIRYGTDESLLILDDSN